MAPWPATHSPVWARKRRTQASIGHFLCLSLHSVFRLAALMIGEAGAGALPSGGDPPLRKCGRLLLPARGSCDADRCKGVAEQSQQGSAHLKHGSRPRSYTQLPSFASVCRGLSDSLRSRLTNSPDSVGNVRAVACGAVGQILPVCHSWSLTGCMHERARAAVAVQIGMHRTQHRNKL